MNKIAIIFKDALTHFNAADGWAMASHVALSFIFSLFPFLIFATALTAFLGEGAYKQEIIDLVLGSWPRQVAEPIAQQIDAVLSQPRADFLTVGIVFTLFFASNAVEAVRVAFNRAYQVSDDRSVIYCRLQSLLFVVASGALLMIISALLVAAPEFQDRVSDRVWFVAKYAPAIGMVRLGLAAAVLGFALFACHTWLPSGERSISDVWPGLVVTLIVWFGAAIMFAAYLTRFADYGATYAGLAGIMTTLIFLYLMAVIVIFGAEVNAARMQFRAEQRQNNSG